MILTYKVKGRFALYVSQAESHKINIFIRNLINPNTIKNVK